MLPAASAGFRGFAVFDVLLAVATAAIAAIWLRRLLALRTVANDRQNAGSRPVLALLAFGAACLVLLRRRARRLTPGR